ncbi:MAG: fimbrillin family protein [Alistipes sp.]|nr:fimbrillin family protein [Alistipes sp.]MBR5771207.1 fimbrillin family protein [Alistipes sp.]
MRIKLCGYLACALMLALGLQSCQQDDVPKGVRYPIVFSNADTRAVADADNLKDGFKVYTYVQGNAGSTSFAKDVEYYETQGVWAFTSPEYWLPNTTYSFKAFYPKELTAGKLTVDNSSKNQYYTISNFDVVNHQEDILVASATATVESGSVPTSGDVNGSKVNLKFQHILALVDIKMKSAISGLTIDTVTIGDADNEGAYSSSTGEWTSTKSGDIEVNSGEALTVGDDFVSVVGDGILVIPASSSGKYLSVKASNGKTYKVDFPSDIVWERGNKYTYTLEIKQSNIIFNEPKVDEWDSENATGSVIIK